MILQAPTDFGPHFLNKIWFLAKATKTHPFMIGDNPVALQNHIDMEPYGNLGLGVKGIEIYFPLSGRCFHVFATTKGVEQKQALFVDLTESELKTRFVRPYRQGKAVLLGDGSVVETRDITWSYIRATKDRADEALARLEEASHRHTREINRSGNVLFMGRFS